MATTAEFWQRGEALDYTNETDELIEANVVLQVGSIIGVTGTVIPVGKVGSLHVGGVWEIAKTGTAAIEMGQVVYWDGIGITDTESDIEAGYAAAAAAADDTTILVKLRG
ncbi:MAG: DUF2190 family protein [Clostridiales bacterium]|nr:DUF2190 family protein [Clostridiales bacterium]